MSALWAAGNSWIDYTAGDFAGDGAFTLAVLFNPTYQTSATVECWHSGTLQNSLLLYNGNLFGTGDSSGGVGDYGSSFPAGPGWCVWAITKPAGAAHYRIHTWTYASDGSGSMSHGEAASAADHSDFAQADLIRLGDWNEGAIGGSGYLAVTSMWDRALSDVELDTLVSTSLSDWAALSPDFSVELSAWDGTTGDVVFAGTSTQVGKTGTVNGGDNPPGFDFSIAPPSSSRTGMPKVWDGEAWVAHPLKVWDGSGWVQHDVLGYDGTEFVASK